MQDASKEDDYDFLKEGRKQTEERLQKALARVKSMVQYPEARDEARDQYRRLLNVVSEIQETKYIITNQAPDSTLFLSYNSLGRNKWMMHSLPLIIQFSQMITKKNFKIFQRWTLSHSPKEIKLKTVLKLV